jgi:hypothetical protein
LGKTAELKGATIMQRGYSADINLHSTADPVLANALQSVFDKTLPVKMYSQPLADKAKNAVAGSLDSWNLRPNYIEVSDGNDKFIVIKADYETPKGITSLYVPIEISDNKVCEALVFVGNSGTQDLNNANLKTYLTTFAGSKLSVGGTAILGALTAAASGGYEVSDAEMALIKLNASRNSKSEFSDGQIVGQKIYEVCRKDVEIPKSNEFESFEKQFTSPYGQASWKFGEDKIKIARDHIARELVGYGHKNPQITVSKSDDNSVFYSVALDAGRVGFVVPVKISNGKVAKPTLMLCNGSVSSFSKEGIGEIYKNNSSDFKAAASASPQFGLKPSDVLNNLRKALAEENYAAAEDSLNVLANSGDERAHALGFQIYMDGLAGNKVANECKCSMIMKSSTSEHPICGHTGLPIHKVYQDKYGNCLPLYRKGMEETYEGAVFNTHKVFI